MESPEAVPVELRTTVLRMLCMAISSGLSKGIIFLRTGQKAYTQTPSTEKLHSSLSSSHVAAFITLYCDCVRITDSRPRQ